MPNYLQLFRAAILAITLLSPAAYADDVSDITASLKATWEKPNQALRVKPVVVTDQFAIAGWLQAERGGRALLQKGHHGWQTLLCAGEITPHLLHQAGLPASTAKRLLAALSQAEKGIQQQEIAQMSSFQGVVNMDIHGHHQPASSASHASHH